MLEQFQLSGVTLTTLLVAGITFALSLVGVTLDAVTVASVTGLVASGLNFLQRQVLPGTVPPALPRE